MILVCIVLTMSTNLLMMIFIILIIIAFLLNADGKALFNFALNRALVKNLF